MLGKKKCKLLKEIRQKIADENDIPFVTRECPYQGPCKGTCPACEAELRYLEEQLEKRRRLGKVVTVAALSATLAVGTVGCPATEPPLTGDVPYTETEATTEYFAGGITAPIESEPSTIPSEDATCITLTGMLPATEEPVVLEGDVIYEGGD